jgi:hypothetical protein
MRTERPAGLEKALAAEQAAQKILGDLPDYREAVLAFAAKRAPRFAREELQ